MCGIWGYIGFKKPNVNLLFSSFNKIQSRGPDSSYFKAINSSIFLGFHRLSINDASTLGDQPFHSRNVKTNLKIDLGSSTYTMCNGEIYNYNNILKSPHQSHLPAPISTSDCEIIHMLGPDAYSHISGEYAYAMLDINDDSTLHNPNYNICLATDHLGIRPLFYAWDENGFAWSSEMKSLIQLFEGYAIRRFPPYSYLKLNNHTLNNIKHIDDIIPVRYADQKNDILTHSVETQWIYNKYPFTIDNLNVALTTINYTLTQSVRAMMMCSDKAVGCLLSGGLDSSIVASLASQYMHKHTKMKLQTFSIGLPGAEDAKHAQLVADYIGSNHTHFEITSGEFLNAIPKVIYTTETWDVTTIRASVGQYLVGKYIKEISDIKVLLVGDGADELCSGYLYSHKAPNAQELHQDNINLLQNLHTYDILRADRGLAAHGIECRVPFLDLRFIDLYLNIDPKLRDPSYWLYSNGAIQRSTTKNQKGIEKALLRKAFYNILPRETIMRQKEAFSDGISPKDSSWYTTIQDYIVQNKVQSSHITTMNTPEANYYMALFQRYFPKCEHVIPQYWLPKWSNNIQEPSARVLDIYQE